MKAIAFFRSLADALFHRSRFDQDLDDELRAHIQNRAADLARDGLSPAEALRRARLEFGALDKAKEQCREALGVHFLHTLAQDLRYAARTLRKSPGFAAVAILTLALGIGANTAIFSIVSAMLLRPLPFPHSDRLFTIESPGPARLIHLSPDDPGRFLQMQEPIRTVESIGVSSTGGANLADRLAAERVLVMQASAGFFQTLGVEPIEGRAFFENEDKPGQNRVVILSWSLWQSRYGGSPAVLGSTVDINSRGFTVVGIMPPSFRFPVYDGAPDVWVPLAPSDDLIAAEGIAYDGVLRLNPGVSRLAAQSEVNTVLYRLYPRSKNPRDLDDMALVPLRAMFESGTRPALLLLLGAAGLVLLIACANIAGLLLARAAARQRETAIRRVLGAGRLRLARQWLAESALLGIIGGALGVLLAVWSLRALVLFGSFYLRNIGAVSVNLPVLCFSAAASLGTGILVGLAPAIRFSSPDLNAPLKGGSSARSAPFGGARLRQSAIVVQVALALALLTGAGLLLKTFANLWRVNPGFRGNHVLTLSLSAATAQYPAASQKIALYQHVIARIRQIPGVEAVGSVNNLPLDVKNSGEYWPMLRFGSRTSAFDGLSGAYRVVSADYFRVMGIPLLRGRAFTHQDTADAPPVAIINESLAREAFGNANPIGQTVSFGGGKNARTCEIVGVVGDVKHRGLDERAEEQVFQSSLQIAAPFATLVIRTRADTGSIAAAVGRAVGQVDGNQAIYNVRAMDQVVAESLSERRFVMLLLAVFSAFALLLSAIGTYGLVSFSASQRIQEIGIRMALGAQRDDILRFILRQGMVPALAGVGLGLAASLGFARLLAGLLFGVKPVDPATLAAAGIALAAAATFASWLPARRATQLDPAVALRHE